MQWTQQYANLNKGLYKLYKNIYDRNAWLQLLIVLIGWKERYCGKKSNKIESLTNVNKAVV